jgi:hypothetical protein
MLAEKSGADDRIEHHGLPSGQLIAEFSDARAAAGRAVGLIICIPGIALVVVGLLNSPDSSWICGMFPVVLGGGFFALGTLRKNNRLLVYSDGLVQIKRGKPEPQLWRDVQDVILEQETTYHNLGMYKTVRNYCSLQRKDGALVKLNAVPITGPEIRAIRKSCQDARLRWHEGQES